jgi:hypothetical protein
MLICSELLTTHKKNRKILVVRTGAVWLNSSRQQQQPPTNRSMKNYIVTIRFQFPAWDEKNGLPYEVTASTKAEAIKEVRRLAARDGHTGIGGKGKASFKAEEI